MHSTDNRLVDVLHDNTNAQQLLWVVLTIEDYQPYSGQEIGWFFHHLAGQISFSDLCHWGFGSIELHMIALYAADMLH